MTNFLSYKRHIAVLDANDTEVESWITVRGNHIPIKKGQSKEEAVKSFLEGKSEKKERKLSNGGSTLGLTKKEHNKIENHNKKVGELAEKYKAEGKKASEFISKLEKKDPEAVKKFVSSVEKGFGKNSPEAQKAREKYGIKTESSKKWSGNWSNKTTKMAKMSSSERNEEVGYPMLEIAYNDVEFTENPEKNRSALSKAIKESGHENADLMQTVLSNLSEKELKDADSIKKGIRDYMKSFNTKKTESSKQKNSISGMKEENGKIEFTRTTYSMNDFDIKADKDGLTINGKPFKVEYDPEYYWKARKGGNTIRTSAKSPIEFAKRLADTDDANLGNLFLEGLMSKKATDSWKRLWGKK